MAQTEGVHFEDSVDSSSLAMSETSATSAGGKVKAQKQKGELDEQLRDYINEWRKQREKEEEELKRLKEKQAKRKEIRAEQEKKLNQQKKEEEERLRKEEAEKKAKEAEEKKKRLEEAEIKRQEMMQAQKEKQQAAGKGEGAKASAGAGVQDARKEMTKTKEHHIKDCQTCATYADSIPKPVFDECAYGEKWGRIILFFQCEKEAKYKCCMNHDMKGKLEK